MSDSKDKKDTRKVTERLGDWGEEKYNNMTNRQRMFCIYLFLAGLTLAIPVLFFVVWYADKSISCAIEMVVGAPEGYREIIESAKQENKQNTKLHRILK